MKSMQLRDVVAPMQLTPREIKFYNEEGFLPLPGFVRGEYVSALHDETLDVLAAHGLTRDKLGKASEAADKLRQFMQYLAGSHLDSLINSEATLNIASQLIQGPAHRYLPFTAVKSGGGGGTFHFHQDNNYTQHDPASGSINIWVALVDMTPENGCLQVIPRSHTQGQITSRTSDDGDTHQQIEVDPNDCFPIRMRAGDAVAFTRWTVHGSGSNHADSPRVAYALQYHREDVMWMNPETQQWQRLVDSQRWSTEPVSQLG